MGSFPTFSRWAERLFAARPAVPPELMTPTAVWGLVDSLFSFDEPDEVLRKAGKDRTELRKVAADDEVATALDTRLAALVATPWRLEPATGPAVKFIWEQLERHATSIVEGAFSGLLYGYSVIERVYARRDDGKLVVVELDERPFDWFTVRRDGGLILRVGMALDEAPLDVVDKFILTRHRPSYRNPRGAALLSRLYWPWFLRSAGWRMWARFLERNASPLMVGMGNNTKTLAEALAAAVNSGVLAIGKDEKVERLDAGARGEAYREFSDQVDRRIQKAVLGQTLTTDVRGSGSYAAAKVHDLVRLDRRLADIRLVTPALQNYVNALMRYNFPGVAPPTVVLQDQAGLEAERAERDLKLAQTGQVEFTEAYWLNRYDFEPGEIKARAPAPALPPGAAPGQLEVPADLSAWARGLFSSTSALRRRQEAIDALGDDAVALSGSPITQADVRAAVKASTGPEDLVDRLGELAGHLPAAAFAELLERALFAAEVIGYAQETEGAA